MNLKRGEIILINRSAADILNEFSEGVILEEVLDKLDIPDKSREGVLDFLYQCVDSEILLASSNLNNSQLSISRTTRHIESSTLSLVLELSTKCNLSCRHCYNHSNPKREESLSIEKVKNVFDDLKSNNIKLKTLTLTGGEPFLYNDLSTVLNLAKDYDFPSIRINTNGTIFSEPLLSNIGSSVSKITAIQVTLLGASEETHNIMTRSKNNFHRVIENIPKFKELGFNVGISFIRSKYSEKEFEKALLLGEKLGVDVTLGDIFPVGRAAKKFDELEIISDKSEIHVACDGKYYGGKEAGKLSEEKILSLLDTFPPELPCGKNTVAISSNGDVIPCMLLQDIVVGNIFKHSLSQIMTSTEMRNFKKESSIENRNICSECELRYACSNKCPAVSLFYGGNISNKSPFCSYY